MNRELDVKPSTPNSNMEATKAIPAIPITNAYHGVDSNRKPAARRRIPKWLIWNESSNSSVCVRMFAPTTVHTKNAAGLTNEFGIFFRYVDSANIANVKAVRVERITMVDRFGPVRITMCPTVITQ